MTQPEPPRAGRAPGAADAERHLTVEHDLDRLADVLALLEDGTGDAVDAGDLDRVRADRAHVDGCAACRARLRAVTAADEVVRDALATAATEPPPVLPDDVATRLDAVVAGLAERPVAQPAAAAAGEPDLAAAEAVPAAGAEAVPAAAAVPAGAEADVVPLAPRRRSGPRLLQAAASVAVLAVVGVGVATYEGATLDGGSAESTASRESAGSAGSTGDTTALALPDAYGQDYRRDTLAEQGAALVGVGPSAAARTEAQDDADGPAGSAGSPGTAAGTADAADVTVAEALAPLRDAATLQGCLREVTQTADPPVAAVDYATLEGRPALIVVVTGDRTEVYAVGPGCREGSADLLSYAATD